MTTARSELRYERAEDPVGGRLLERRPVFLGLAAALVALAVVPEFSSRTLPDTAWLLYAAGHWLDGARLYVDLVEVNPPLIVWLNALPVLLARALHAPPVLVYRLLVLALALGSAAASARLLARIVAADQMALRRALSLLVLFAVLTFARQDYGEREHLLLALTFPYVLLCAVRAGGGNVSRPAALATGLAAALGIALKPYFVMLWIGLELWLWLGTRGGRRARPESLVVPAAGAAYALAVVQWAPEYFGVVRTMAGPYYQFLSNSFGVTALLGDGVPLALGAMAGYLALRRGTTHRTLADALFWATLALYVSGVLQHKGWRYHFYPSMAFGVVLLGLLALDLRLPAGSALARAYAMAARATAGAVPLLTALACIVQAAHPLNPRYDADPDIGRLIPVVRAHAAGGSVLVLSWSMASTFPLLTYAGAESASRFNSLWILGAVYRDQIFGDAPLRYRERGAMGELERYLVDAVVEDLARRRPALLLVLRPAPDVRSWRLRRLDFLQYFGADPRFAALFERYRYKDSVGQYWVFERIPDSAPPVPPRRRDEPPTERTPP